MATVLERLRIFTPLGIRFLDAATDLPVGEGLSVRARPMEEGGMWQEAVRTTSGIYAFHGLKGLRSVEYPGDDLTADPLQPVSPPDILTFLVEVRDRRRRFVPVMFTEELPLPERGLYRGPISVASPPVDASAGFYLFSAPTRTPASGIAEVRASLADVDQDEGPAAYALAEVSHGGRSWYGLSDESGALAVLFPYPALTTTLSGSPPAGRTPLHEQQWTVSIRIWYSPHQLEYLDESRLPELRSIAAQEPALIYSTLATSPVLDVPGPDLTATLRYGEVCVLRTGDRPVLLVEGQPSSP